MIGKSLTKYWPLGIGVPYISKGGYRIAINLNSFSINYAAADHEHRIIAEAALGKPLRSTAHVHHVNYDKLDNRPENLVICNDAAYHKLLHHRTDAYNACGHADWEKCYICHQYDNPVNLVSRANGRFRHKNCSSVKSEKT